MFTIEHEFDATVITLIDESDAPLREDVTVSAFDPPAIRAAFDTPAIRTASHHRWSAGMATTMITGTTTTTTTLDRTSTT